MRRDGIVVSNGEVDEGAGWRVVVIVSFLMKKK
jgi:hypothetical protein